MYQLTKNPDVVIRLDDVAYIPRDHRWWGDYETWLQYGNTPIEASDTRELDMRAMRDDLLRSCDWTQGADSPLNATTKAAWATYRQALRDVPSQSSFPDSINWPVQP